MSRHDAKANNLNPDANALLSLSAKWLWYCDLTKVENGLTLDSVHCFIMMDCASDFVVVQRRRPLALLLLLLLLLLLSFHQLLVVDHQHLGETVKSSTASSCSTCKWVGDTARNILLLTIMKQLLPAAARCPSAPPGWWRPLTGSWLGSRHNHFPRPTDSVYWLPVRISSFPCSPKVFLTRCFHQHCWIEFQVQKSWTAPWRPLHIQIGNMLKSLTGSQTKPKKPIMLSRRF